MNNHRISILMVAALQLLVACSTMPSKNTVAKNTAAGPADFPAGLPFLVLPFTGGSMHVLADDMDGDGYIDLAFTAHGGNTSKVMYQQKPRSFIAGPTVEEVGFHPNDMVRLPWPERRLYLSNAEGSARLLVLEGTEDRQLVKVSQRRQGFPRSTTPFHWPDWGLGLAVAPKAGVEVTLLKGFDPLTAEVEQRIDLDLGASNWAPKEIAVADIDGDGIDELMLFTTLTNRIWVIRYPGKGNKPVAEELWRFKGGIAYYVVPADVNGDGAMDLLAGAQADPLISVLINDGKGNFTLQEIAFASRGGIQRLVTGVDQDGVRYLFAAGHVDLVLYRYTNGWNAKPEVQTVPLKRAQGLHSAVMADIDGDGWLDVVIARNRKDYSSLLIYGPLWENFGLLDQHWPMEQR